jgi:hypothetical protein
MSESSDTGLWSHKPWWCQPWTIVLTGLIVVGGSWLMLHRLWVTGSIAIAVVCWWVLFLVIAPAAYHNQSR